MDVSVARTVNVYVPGTLGRPSMTPSPKSPVEPPMVSAMPGGKLPLGMVQPNDRVPRDEKRFETAMNMDAPCPTESSFGLPLDT